MAPLTPPLQAIDDSLTLRGGLLDEWVDLGRQIASLEARRAELLATRLDLLAEEHALDPGSDDMAFRSMSAEYAAAAHIPPGSASARITGAWVLVRQFPSTLSALAAGAISKQHAEVIVDEAPNVSGHPDASSLRGDYEQQVLPFAEHDTAARTRARARAVAATVHPDGMSEQHRRGRSERAVTVKPDGDGMAVLTAILPELLAYAIHDRLTSMADAVTEARPKGHRRPRASALAKVRAERDAAVAEQTAEPAPTPPLRSAWACDDPMAGPAPWEHSPDHGQTEEPPRGEVPVEEVPVGEVPCDRAATDGAALIDETNFIDDAATHEHETGEALFHDSIPMHDGYGALEHDARTTDQLRADILADLLLTATPTSVTTTALESVRAAVSITISASTLTGADDAMAEFDGHGPLTPDVARLLAGRAGSWDRAFLDPRGMVVETDNYVPTAGMKRFLRARDQHCRFPGCRTPAHRCQIDHNHDHAKGGPTALCNLSLFCTSHHPLKHPDVDERDRWSARQLDDGVILWTSPLGRTYADEPPLRVMFT